MTDLLPELAPGHWDTPASENKIVAEYADMTREQLCNGAMSDLALANRQFMASRTDLDLVGWQTAAKERIRWLSVQLAIANARLSHRPTKPDAGYQQAFYQLAELMGIGAQPVSPAEVWESQMLPKLKAAFSPAKPGEGDKPVAELERWGFKWKGHDYGTHEKMADGYWTPWHIANDRIEALARPAPAAPDDVVERVALSICKVPCSWADAPLNDIASPEGIRAIATKAIAAIGSGERGEVAEIVKFLRDGATAYTGHNLTNFGAAYEEAATAIEQGQYKGR